MTEGEDGRDRAGDRPSEIKRIGAPVMGITLLVALAILAMRARSSPLDTSALEAV